MNFGYGKMEFRGADDSKENISSKDGEKGFYGCRSDEEDVKSVGKDGPASKPEDVKNGDLVSLLLAATPPYLYNIPLIPQTFFFSEMLKSFVQAKTERQNVKSQQTPHKRQRKRPWREVTSPIPSYYESDKPLELTTPKQMDDKPKERAPKRDEKKYQSSEFSNSNFTAEKLANSSITNSVPEGSGANSELLPPTPPLWYPPLYPPHPPFGIDPLHFFIDLRVSAQVWDRKLAAERAASPLSSRDKANDSPLVRNRHKSAFSAPNPWRETEEAPERKRSPHSVHYLMSNLRNIYRPDEAKDKPGEDEEDEEEEEVGGGGGVGGGEKEVEEEEAAVAAAAAAKKCKDLRALIGLELVVDYVKQESDASEDEEPLDVDEK